MLLAVVATVVVTVFVSAVWIEVGLNDVAVLLVLIVVLWPRLELGLELEASGLEVWLELEPKLAELELDELRL